ncbi:unnamed protein product [Didymodactylos carnosus]|uniref:G-protein coupled receptors family 1 profile domain-containing protein n=1 Tax=Didymodactylos carnosus TaxID=1234261 RepID=A0A815T9J0_9BILA|nr:unnamed protein product [Didymodactylos carnosus]CAF1500091.1 unnamed protein product [Didymodactylos carnosus]CAF3787168.1 unnamed protein product [Didymodactylos carnosus]CAF4361897.1 unnamed protein product [Didymodactylos carnosus]
MPILVLFLFGLLTLRNIRQHRQQVHVATYHASVNLHRRRDRQMIRLILCQTCVYVILSLPSTITLTYNSYVLPPSATAAFLTQLFGILTYTLFAIGFFINILSAAVYRQEFLKILNQIFKKIFRSTLIERRFLDRRQPQTQMASTLVRRVSTLHVPSRQIKH